jgi:hypothetical protein
MPEISRFYGILIRMYLIDREHPPRHIHIKYNDYEAVMLLETLELIEGELPKRCFKLVKKWSKKHQNELISMWDSQEFHQIEPLR